MPLIKSLSFLVIVSNESYLEQLTTELAGAEFRVRFCAEMASAQCLLKQYEFDLIFCEELVPESLRRSVRVSPHRRCSVPIIVVSRQNDWSSYLEVLRSGAFDRLVLPPARGELAHIIYSALSEALHSLNARVPFGTSERYGITASRPLLQ